MASCGVGLWASIPEFVAILSRNVHHREAAGKAVRDVAAGRGTGPRRAGRRRWSTDRPAGWRLLGVVEHGTTPQFRPGTSPTSTNRTRQRDKCSVSSMNRNEDRCSTWTLAVKHELRSLLRSRRDHKSPYARAAKPPPGRSVNHQKPAARGWASGRGHAPAWPIVADLSPEHLRHLFRPFWQAGWTPADCLHALDHDPSGRQHGCTDHVR